MDVHRLELQMTNNVTVLAQNISNIRMANQNDIDSVRYELEQNIIYFVNETRRSLSSLMAEVDRVEQDLA